jgi:macrodomain Ter protein organizer (MatP/YcbG family)
LDLSATQVQNQLAQEANLYGLTLSEYVDTILGQRHHQTKQQKTEMTYSKEELEVLIKKIAFYENDRMQCRLPIFSTV